MKKNPNTPATLFAALAIIMAGITASPGEAPASSAWFDTGTAPPEWAPAPKNTELGQSLLAHVDEAPLPLNEGRIIFNTRFRYEHAAQQGLDASQAFTLRTRVGYETPRWHGLYGLAEFENTWAMNLSQYQATPPPGGRAVIADPRNNQLNQLFLGYSGYNSSFKGGRQIVNLDNQRFVGAVAWRQNDQTFDAVRVTTEVLKDTWLSYTYNWQVNRVFGVYANPNLERFISSNHFVNAHYEGLPEGKLGTYFYYLDLGGNGAPLAGSTAGLFYEAAPALNEDWSLPLRAEYAFQVNNGASAPAQGSFWLNYWHASLGASYQKKYEIGLGFENLGGNGTRAFQTPLATLHKFNGYADQFLVTPAGGLQDYYIYANAALPYAFKAEATFHYFTAANSSNNYGREIDLGLSRKITDNLSGLVKFAYYEGNGTPNVGLAANVTKVWVQFDFSL